MWCPTLGSKRRAMLSPSSGKRRGCERLQPVALGLVDCENVTHAHCEGSEGLLLSLTNVLTRKEISHSRRDLLRNLRRRGRGRRGAMVVAQADHKRENGAQ